MEDRIEQLINSANTAGVYAARVAGFFEVGIEHDGKGFVFSGDARNVICAKDAFIALDKLSSDTEIDETDILYIMNLSKDGRLEEFLKTSDEVFYMTPSGRAIKARTLGQRMYVDSLKQSELVICSGPAGTGKTFLGVAMAVKALKAREVSRIILTRPAIEAGERLGFLPGDIEEKVKNTTLYRENDMLTLYGETLGMQDLKYGLTNGKISYRLFDVYVGKPRQGRYLDFNECKAFAEEIGIERVPSLYVGPYSYEKVKEYTDGKTTCGTNLEQIREGIVIRPLNERVEDKLGRVMVKSISQAYKLRKGETTEYN